MNELVRGITVVNKPHCARTVVVDASKGCTNSCHYCFDLKWAPLREATYKRCGGETPLSIDYVRAQLSGRSKLKDYLNTYKVVRIGAMCDIRRGDSESYDNTRNLMQLLWGAGYHYMLVTKSCHSIDDDFLGDIRRHEGLLSVTIGYNSNKSGALFEDMATTPIDGRKDLLGRAIAKGVRTTLRINPMHPDYMDDVFGVTEWFKSVGGERIIFETLRISAGWQKYMPKVDFSKYVGTGRGGYYSGYLTPNRELGTLMCGMATSYARRIGIEKVTVCADPSSNEKFGYKHGEMDCCHGTEIWPVPLPVIGPNGYAVI